jgi:hypothetical protein
VYARRPPLALLAATLVTFAASGCGTTTTVGGDGSVQIALSEYRVTPQDVHARRGLLTIIVHNYGRLTHSLLISQDGRTEAVTKPIAPGQTVQLEAALVPGRYQMASSILSDQALGAYGTLDVGS